MGKFNKRESNNRGRYTNSHTRTDVGTDRHRDTHRLRHKKWTQRQTDFFRKTWIWIHATNRGEKTENMEKTQPGNDIQWKCFYFFSYCHTDAVLVSLS